MALSPDNTRLIALTEQQIVVYDFVAKKRIRKCSFVDNQGQYVLQSGSGGLDADAHADADSSGGRRARPRGPATSSRGQTEDGGGGGGGATYGARAKLAPRPVLTSVSISRDSKYMLISQNPNWIRMVDIDSGEEVRVFEGHVQEQFIIRSSWGGANEAFVASGSEGEALSCGLIDDC
jgi:hypothetical protein